MRACGSNFSDKNPWLHHGYTFKLVGKNWIKGVRRAPWSSILFIVNYCCIRYDAKRNWKWKNKAFLTKIFLIGGTLIKGARARWATPWLRLWFWNKIASLNSFTKKTFKAKLNFFFLQRGGLESSHLDLDSFLKPPKIAWYYYDKDTWSSLL